MMTHTTNSFQAYHFRHIMIPWLNQCHSWWPPSLSTSQQAGLAIRVLLLKAVLQLKHNDLWTYSIPVQLPAVLHAGALCSLLLGEQHFAVLLLAGSQHCQNATPFHVAFFNTAVRIQQECCQH